MRFDYARFTRTVREYVAIKRSQTDPAFPYSKSMVFSMPPLPALSLSPLPLSRLDLKCTRSSRTTEDAQPPWPRRAPWAGVSEHPAKPHRCSPTANHKQPAPREFYEEKAHRQFAVICGGSALIKCQFCQLPKWPIKQQFGCCLHCHDD